MAKLNLVWEEIPGKAIRTVETDPAAILKAASIKLNLSAAKQLGTPDKVILAYDAENKVIAIKAYGNEENLKAYDFADKLDEKGILIRCKHFMQSVQANMNLNLEEGKKLSSPVEYNGRSKLLAIQVPPSTGDKMDEGN